MASLSIAHTQHSTTSLTWMTLMTPSQMHSFFKFLKWFCRLVLADT